MAPINCYGDDFHVLTSLHIPLFAQPFRSDFESLLLQAQVVLVMQPTFKLSLHTTRTSALVWYILNRQERFYWQPPPHNSTMTHNSALQMHVLTQFHSS
jgi:hypothetical protein